MDETTKLDPQGDVRPVSLIRQDTPFVEESPRGKSNNLAAVSPDVCYRCHADLRRFEEIVHPHQIGVPFDFQCTACHNPKSPFVDDDFVFDFEANKDKGTHEKYPLKYQH